MVQPPPPGWYPDPSSSQGELRWWDGRQWTAQTMPQPTGSPYGDAQQGWPPHGKTPSDRPPGPAHGHLPPGPPSHGPSGQFGAGGQFEPAGRRRGAGRTALVLGAVVLVVVVAGLAGGSYVLFFRDGGDVDAADKRTPAPTLESSSAPQSPTEQPLSVSYEDAEIGLTMSMPEGWTQPGGPLLADDANTSGAYTSAYSCPYGGDPSATCYKGMVLTGTIPDNPRATTPYDMARVVGGTLGPMSYGLEPGEITPTTFGILRDRSVEVDGFPGHRIRLTIDIPDSDVSGLLEAVAIDKDGRWVFVLFAADQVDGAPTVEDFHRMLESVSLSAK